MHQSGYSPTLIVQLYLFSASVAPLASNYVECALIIYNFTFLQNLYTENKSFFFEEFIQSTQSNKRKQQQRTNYSAQSQKRLFFFSKKNNKCIAYSIGSIPCQTSLSILYVQMQFQNLEASELESQFLKAPIH